MQRRVKTMIKVEENACIRWTETSVIIFFLSSPISSPIACLSTFSLVCYSIRSYIIPNVSFDSNRRWEVEIINHYGFRSPFLFQLESIISFLHAFVSLVFYRLDGTRGMSGSRERSSAIYEVFFGPRGDCATAWLKEMLRNGTKSCRRSWLTILVMKSVEK